jgi:hypothetical protein
MNLESHYAPDTVRRETIAGAVLVYPEEYGPIVEAKTWQYDGYPRLLAVFGDGSAEVFHANKGFWVQ